MTDSRMSRSDYKRKAKAKKRRKAALWLLIFTAAIAIAAAGSYAGLNLTRGGSDKDKTQGTVAQEPKPAEEHKDGAKETAKVEPPPSNDQTPPPSKISVETKNNSGFTGLTGRVIDTASKKPIVDAIVETSDKSIAVKTSTDGVYKMELKAGEAVAITVSSPGYFSAVAAGSVDNSQTKVVDFELRQQKGDLAPPSPVAF